MVKFPCQSQFTDDFTDGDFIADPVWNSSNKSGDGADFQVQNGELQSKGPAASSTIWISNSNLPDMHQQKVVWQFTARYDASPSGSNNTEIYLFCDNSDLSSTADGYFIRLGESGNDDGIDLFKIGSSTPLIADPNPSIASGYMVNIRVTRDTSGKWELEADPSGGFAYVMIGTAVDKEFTTGSHFGFKVEHTSTRSQAFFFDNISISSSDIKAPDLVSVEVVSRSQLDLIFSERLETSAGEDINNYFVSDGIGYPSSVTVDEADSRIVHLDFASDFAKGKMHQIEIKGVQDLSGNAISSIFYGFVYFVEELAAFKDVIITEIFADPSPPNDLPEREFIEVYNNSNKVFDLANWQFSDLKDTAILNSSYFFPGDYLILCPEEAAPELAPYGQVMGLNNWPTLNNNEDFLLIRDAHNRVTDSVHYSSSWYKSSLKSDGGWTLELIDPANLCGSGGNWTASEHLSGGTPGAINSVISENPDFTPPLVTEVFGLRADSVVVRFNEVLDTDIVPGNFIINPAVEVSSVIPGSGLDEIGLKLSDQLHGSITYSLKVNGIRDCSGNLIDEENLYDFYLVEPADSFEIIINEVLFNPYSGGVDFVELYNNSSKHVNLKDLLLANGEKLDGQYHSKQIFPVAASNIVLKPHNYIALTESSIVLKENYPRSDERNFNEVKRLPAYNDDTGVVILLNPDSAVLDLFEYSEDLHLALLADKEGVSLERISFVAPTNESNSWKSAASAAGFATPGYINSQVSKGFQTNSGQIIAEPKVIVPDGSGHNDYTTINYAFDKAGYIVTTRILDAFGRTIKILGENDYLPAEGFYTWDATDEVGSKVRTGYYLVFLEAFGLNGEVLRFKEKVVVGTKF
ncbi:lamin tail domain-containing protein [Fulvivirga ulvae]|uniref:lamin tail domain-containing protein n=1 Tax=Fulvivirga ulvae TaxID=2904245 RepID=UPI001F32F528|nr:lamin tail domain-containing protein [Fulvivirga ulvae]UII34146.1 lamin tail domain-containing protein [Fulvivirga ulvae]